MKFCSTRNNSIQSDFSNAVLQGLAPGGGLFVPNNIPALDQIEWRNFSSLAECGRAFIPHFIKDEITLLDASVPFGPL